MKELRYKKKLGTNLAPCETVGCKNYWNTVYKNSNGKCSPAILEGIKGTIN